MENGAIGLVIMPYYANYLGLPDDQVIEVCRRFIENSCRNFGKCDKVYDSWLRSMLRTVRQHNYKVLSKQRLDLDVPLASVPMFRGVRLERSILVSHIGPHDPCMCSIDIEHIP